MVHEYDMKRVTKGSDIVELTTKIENLTKQKEYLQSKCREAGQKLNALTREFDKVVEENINLKVMMKR